MFDFISDLVTGAADIVSDGYDAVKSVVSDIDIGKTLKDGAKDILKEGGKAAVSSFFGGSDSSKGSSSGSGGSSASGLAAPATDFLMTQSVQRPKTSKTAVAGTAQNIMQDPMELSRRWANLLTP